MFRFLHAAIGWALLVGAAAAAEPTTPASTTAQPPGNSGLKAQVEQLFSTGWTRTIDARTEANRQYLRLAAAAPSDARIPYAYALIQIHQYRYAEAVKTVDKVLALDPQNLTARKLRLWLMVLLKDYHKALAAMPEAAAAMPKDLATGDAELPYTEFAALLGRLCGFLEGPVKGSVDATALAACVERIVTQMPPPRAAAFENGRKAVLKQFSAVLEEGEMTNAAAKESAEKTKKHVVAELERQTEELTAKTDAEKTRLDELKKSLDYQLDTITTNEKRIAPQYRQLQTQATGVKQDLLAIGARVAQSIDFANREKDPDRRQAFLNDAAAWQLQSNQRAAALRDLERQAAALNTQARTLAQQRREIDTRWQRESGSADKLEGALKRVRRDKDRAETKGDDEHALLPVEQTSRATSLSNFVPPPVSLEEEKTRVIGSF